MSILVSVFALVFVVFFAACIGMIAVLEGRTFLTSNTFWGMWRIMFALSLIAAALNTAACWSVLSEEVKYIEDAKTPEQAFTIMKELGFSGRADTWKYSCYSRENWTEESCDAALDE